MVRSTPQDKMNAIARVHAGESKAGVARDIGVPESTLRGWCKAEEKINSQLNNMRPAGTYDPSKITLDLMENQDVQHSTYNLPHIRPNQNLLTCQPKLVDSVTKSGSEKNEIKLSPKRKLINFLASDQFATAVMNTISMSNDEIYPAVTHALYRRIQYHLNNPCTDTLNLPLNLTRYGSDRPPPFSSSLPSAANLLVNNQQLQQLPTRNNDAMENIFLLPVDKSFRKYNAVGLTSTTVENPTKVATRSQSPNAGSTFESVNNQNSPMPATSTNNGCAITNTFTKSSKQSPRKWLHDISNQLRQQDVLLPVRECNTEEMISNNTMNNNNNNAHRVDNETTSLNSLPPESSDILAKFPEFVEWLQEHGASFCTNQQLIHIKTILYKVMNWETQRKCSLETKAKVRRVR